MIGTRLALALDAGGLVLPQDGTVAVVGPGVTADLKALPAERALIIQGSKPVLDAWAARGYEVVPGISGSFAAVIVCLPRAKTKARAMIAQAVTHSHGIVVVDGQKTDGVDSILRDLRKRVPVSGPITKSHGKLYWFTVVAPEAFEDWQQGPTLTGSGFWSAPGVFSADGIDPASALLAAALPDKLGKRVVDLGAGWGFLSAHVLTRPDVERIDLVEADFMSLECARRNVTDPRAAFHWADATRWSSSDPANCVVMNPPFHTGRAADPALGQAFVRSAARILAPGGDLWMVANRHLPYEDVLHEQFTNIFELGADARFKLFHARRPRRAARSAQGAN